MGHKYIVVTYACLYLVKPYLVLIFQEQETCRLQIIRFLISFGTFLKNGRWSFMQNIEFRHDGPILELISSYKFCMTTFTSLCFYAIQTALIFLESMLSALFLYIRWVPIILEREMMHYMKNLNAQIQQHLHNYMFINIFCIIILVMIIITAAVISTKKT